MGAVNTTCCIRVCHAALRVTERTAKEPQQDASSAQRMHGAQQPGVVHEEFTSQEVA